MDYLFLAFLILGLLLVVGSYLFIAYRSFKNHFITGLLALIPVVNLLIVVIMWRDMRYGFYTSILGLMLAGGAWYLGADQQLLNSSSSLLSSFNNNNRVENQASGEVEAGETETGNTSITRGTTNQSLSLPLPLSRPQDIEISNTETLKEAGIDRSEENEDYIIKPAPPLSRNQPLPTSVVSREEASFSEISVADLASYVGKIVRVETDNGRQIEGKVLAVKDATFSIEEHIAAGSVAYEIKFDKLSRIEARQ